MAKGTVNLSKSSTTGGYIIGKVEWESIADTGLNNSDITAKLYVRKLHHDMTLTVPTTGTWSFSLNVNGSNISGTVRESVLQDWVLIATKTVNNISHDPNGTKTIAITASVTAPNGTSLAGHVTKVSNASITLDTIKRAATIIAVTDHTLNAVTSVTLGNHIGVKFAPTSLAYTYKIDITVGSYTYSESYQPTVSTAQTYLIDTSVSARYEAFAKQIIGNPPVATGTVKLSTLSGSTLIGYDTETFQMTVPNNSSTQPSPGMTLQPVNTNLPTAFNGLYVQGKSRVGGSFAGSGKYNATIKSYSMSVGGKSYSSPYASDILTQVGAVEVKGSATDSRGFTGTQTKSITVIPYSAPKINVSICDRCDANGNLTDSGTYLKIKAKRTYSKVESDGKAHNSCRIQFRYAVEGGSFGAWQTILPAESTSDEVETGPLLGGALSVASSYIVQVGVIDSLGEYSNTSYSVLSEAVFMHRRAGGQGMGLGKYCNQDGLLDVAWDTRIRGDLLLGDNGKPVMDYIVEYGQDEGWNYILWNSGLCEAWYYESLGSLSFTEKATGVYSNAICTAAIITLPACFLDGRIYHASANAPSNAYTMAQVASYSTASETLTYRIWTNYPTTVNNLAISIYIAGRTG